MLRTLGKTIALTCASLVLGTTLATAAILLRYAKTEPATLSELRPDLLGPALLLFAAVPVLAVVTRSDLGYALAHRGGRFRQVEVHGAIQVLVHSSRFLRAGALVFPAGGQRPHPQAAAGNRDRGPGLQIGGDRCEVGEDQSGLFCGA